MQHIHLFYGKNYDAASGVIQNNTRNLSMISVSVGLIKMLENVIDFISFQMTAIGMTTIIKFTFKTLQVLIKY